MAKHHDFFLLTQNLSRFNISELVVGFGWAIGLSLHSTVDDDRNG
jgi:hypothetical protein